MGEISILIVDDHVLFAEGFASLARTLRPSWRLVIAHSAFEAMQRFEVSRPDLLVIDAGLPGEDGIALVKRVAQAAPDLPQIVISGRNDPVLRARALACGAHGFIAKTVQPDEMAAAIDTVLGGGRVFEQPAPEGVPSLTGRQCEVLDLLAQGHGNKEIRHRLGIAERTVRAHLTELFHLLGVGSRMQAVIRARELGLVE